jgi:hypothetical protein
MSKNPAWRMRDDERREKFGHIALAHNDQIEGIPNGLDDNENVYPDSADHSDRVPVEGIVWIPIDSELSPSQYLDMVRKNPALKV